MVAACVVAADAVVEAAVDVVVAGGVVEAVGVVDGAWCGGAGGRGGGVAGVGPRTGGRDPTRHTAQALRTRPKNNR